MGSPTSTGIPAPRPPNRSGTCRNARSLSSYRPGSAEAGEHGGDGVGGRQPINVGLQERPRRAHGQDAVHERHEQRGEQAGGLQRWRRRRLRIGAGGNIVNDNDVRQVQRILMGHSSWRLRDPIRSGPGRPTDVFDRLLGLCTRAHRRRRRRRRRRRQRTGRFRHDDGKCQGARTFLEALRAGWRLVPLSLGVLIRIAVPRVEDGSPILQLISLRYPAIFQVSTAHWR